MSTFDLFGTLATLAPLRQDMVPGTADELLVAAYGEYGPGYIGTALSYEQGGYETNPTRARVAPEVEEVLMREIRHALIG